MPGRSESNPLVLVLLSGGIDSTACLEFYSDQQVRIGAAFVDYGQAAAAKEAIAAEAVASHYRVPLARFSWRGPTVKGQGLIAARNALLLVGALMETEETPATISLGIHYGTDYSDCSPAFLDAMQRLFDVYHAGRVHVAAPFLNWSKREIWDFCRQRQFPFQLTYSCELADSEPCGRCRSCRDVEALHART
jgi:7-cyano-7-deazaguanine synthase